MIQVSVRHKVPDFCLNDERRQKSAGVIVTNESAGSEIFFDLQGEEIASVFLLQLARVGRVEFDGEGEDHEAAAEGPLMGMRVLVRRTVLMMMMMLRRRRRRRVREWLFRLSG